MTDTVFDGILRRQIPADIVYEDEKCIAFRDANPQAPVHVLVIPREKLTGLQQVGLEHADLLGHLLVVAGRVARQEGVAEAGYRCVVNTGPEGGQEIPHLHVHVLGGRRMSWPPG